MAAFVIVACFVLFGLTAIPIQRMTPWMIQCYHLSSSYRRCGTDQLISLPFLFCRLLLFVWFVFVFALVGFLVLFVCFVCIFSVGIVTANRTLHWSYLSSLLKSTIVKMDDVFALINRICQYATGLQA